MTEAATNDDEVEVILGPDLTPTRSYMDKKIYRHITLPNGLQCVLICDTVALKQRKLDGYDDDDESDDDHDHSSSGDESEESDDGDDDAGTRKAATALLVNVGS